MPRRTRRSHWTNAACYHVISRRHNREVVFADAAEFDYFRMLLAKAQERFELALYHYCLMHSHVHLLLRQAEPADLSPFMAGLLRSYVHYFNRRYAFVGHLWQGRFKSCAIEAEEYLLSCARYIERNPLTARLVEEPWDWPWSSCRLYALGERDQLVSRNPYFGELAREMNERQRRWREFLLGADEREAAFCGEDWAAGSDAFRRQMQVVGSRPRRRGRGRPSGPAPAVPTLFSELDGGSKDA